MNDCESIARKLFDYLDKELCSEDVVQLETHLEACRRCFGRFEFERMLREHVRKSTFHSCPDKVKRRIEDIISKF